MTDQLIYLFIYLFNSVLVVDTTQFGLVCRIPNEKTFCMAFSPKGTHLSTWEQYTGQKLVSNQTATPIIY